MRHPIARIGGAGSLLIVLETAHILRFLTHSRGDGFNGDKDADLCIVLIHDVAEGAHLGNSRFAGLHLSSKYSMSLLLLSRYSEWIVIQVCL